MKFYVSFKIPISQSIFMKFYDFKNFIYNQMLTDEKTTTTSFNNIVFKVISKITEQFNYAKKTINLNYEEISQIGLIKKKNY